MDVAISDEISATFVAIIAGMALDTENLMELKTIEEKEEEKRKTKIRKIVYLDYAQFISNDVSLFLYNFFSFFF